MAIWLPLMLAGLVAGSQFVTNPEDLGKRFARAQKLLATGDFAGAQRIYEGVLAVPDGVLMRASAVRVVVDEQSVGVQAAARYQLANMGRKQAQLWQQEAALADSVEADSLAELATASLRQAADRFAALRDEEDFELRETAAYLVVECFFNAEEYAAAAAAGEVLLRLFPNGRYAERTRYTLGWAWFYQQEYAEAVAAFEAYVQDAPAGIRADRARLQMGLALEALERYEDALAAFGPLADAYDPASMDDAEKRAVALAGLREGQSRRSLAAKAWIKRGDMLKTLERYEDALAAYKKVSRDFPQEPHLAEQAWVRQALLAQTAHGVDASLEVYRYAAEQAERPAFRARMQAGLMSLLFDEGRYVDALAAHRLYLAAYRAFADVAGVSIDEAVFRQAECLRLMGEESTVADSADVWFAEALGLYGEVGTYLEVEALFWQGTIHQALGDSAAALAQFEQVGAGEVAPELACRALLQIARLRHEQSDALYEQILTQCTDEEVRGLAALVLGRRYRQAGRGDKARQVLESIAPPQPQYTHAQMELAQLYVEEGKADEAIALIARQVEQTPNAELTAQLGLLHQRQGEHELALPLLREALPQLEEAMAAAAQVGLGWSLYKTGRYEAAWGEWEKAWQKGVLAGDQRRALLQAMSACAQTLEDSQRMAAVYRAMAASEATRTEGLLGLGQWYLDQDEAAQAAAQVRPLLEHEDRAWLLLGRALAAQDSLAAAREVLEEGVARASIPEEMAEFHFELGSVALGERNYEAAERAFSVVSEMTPRRAMRAAALFYKGHSLQARGERVAAQAAFEELVVAYPDQPQAPEAELLIGELYYETAEYERALAWYERVFGSYPDSKDAPEALYGAAWCQLELERIEPMGDLFLRLVRQYPQHERAHQGLMHLGDYYYNGHQFIKASRLYEQVVERFPETTEAVQARQLLAYLADAEADSLYSEGMALYDEGAFERAIAVLEEVIARYPNTPSEAAARCNIGVSYYQMDHWRLAALAYEEAVAALEGRKEEWRALEFARSNREMIGRTYLGEVAAE
ncbi:MAG: tetratricopeptide repeat protein [Gemmatimonadota bacterium]|nr:tetratricopeptide repeat protein [Gemmatimonadota bacterium]